MRLVNKRILLGVTGSIAAYKAADLVRRLRDEGADVRVVMTRGASEFVAPMTFQALSGYPVHQDLLDTEAEAGMGHIQLARWADAVVIAPASADFISRLAQGRADDLLSAVCLASDVPLAVAPAMNKHMWDDQAVQANMRLLGQRGILQLGPDSGEQACGDVGSGRMLEPLEIVSRVGELFETGSLAGLRVTITAGPTREALDPVRFLSNHSSGKMGYAIAEAAVEAGAQVHLITGPVSLALPERLTATAVVSAEDMLQAVMSSIAETDIFIATAAVADYRPVHVQDEKIKKNAERHVLELEKTPDILATVKRMQPGLFCLGFAAETSELEKHARAKLEKKAIEMVAANLVGPAAVNTAGTFNSEVNALEVFWQDGEASLPAAPKTRLARQLVSLLAQRYSCFQAQLEKHNVVPINTHKQ